MSLRTRVLGRKESAVQQREMNGNSAVVLFSSPHQPNHLEKKKKKAFLHSVLVISPEVRHPLPIVVLAHCLKNKGFFNNGKLPFQDMRD